MIDEFVKLEFIGFKSYVLSVMSKQNTIKTDT